MYDMIIIYAPSEIFAGGGGWGQAHKKAPMRTKKYPLMEKRGPHKEKKAPPYGEKSPP